jgi:serine/threonine protein kinase
VAAIGNPARDGRLYRSGRRGSLCAVKEPSAVAPATPVLPRVGELIAGKYRLEHLLGSGGMGTVFEARNELTGKRFAIKWLLPEFGADPEFVQRFLREARVGGSLEHPHLVEVYDVGADRGSLYMLMELLDGESLAERLTRVHRLSPAEARNVLLPCARAVACAHASGVVHRDLKPHNIFLCRDAEGGVQPKVLDFGISKTSTNWSSEGASLTRSGVLIGTVSYMPLEQLRGDQIDERVDVYALGVVLYEALSGRLPYVAQTVADFAVKLATEAPVPLERLLPDIPSWLVQLVQRATARDREQRFRTMSQVVNALQSHSFNELQQPLRLASALAETERPRYRQPAGTAPTAPPTNAPSIRIVSRRVMGAASAALVVGALGLTYLAFHPAAHEHALTDQSALRSQPTPHVALTLPAPDAVRGSRAAPATPNVAATPQPQDAIRRSPLLPAERDAAQPTMPLSASSSLEQGERPARSTRPLSDPERRALAGRTRVRISTAAHLVPGSAGQPSVAAGPAPKPAADRGVPANARAPMVPLATDDF